MLSRVQSILTIACVALGALALHGQTEADWHGAIGGVVVEAGSREPIHNAIVSTRPTDSYRYFSTRTDTRGRFLLRGLEPGRYVFYVEHPAYLRPARQIETDVAADETAINLKIELHRPGVISGEIFDEYGDPMIGAHVEAARVLRRNGKLRRTGTSTATTDDRGKFRILELEPGYYAVWATYASSGYGDFEWQPSLDDPDGERLEMAYVRTYYPNTLDLASAVLVEVASGAEAAGIQIRMRPQRTLSISGRITGSGQGGNRGASLMLRSLTEGAPQDIFSLASLGRMGNFVFGGLSPGEYLLWADVQTPGAKRTGWLTVQLTDQSLTDVQLELKEGTTVSGTVLWEGGEHDGNIQTVVFLRPIDAPLMQRSGTVQSDPGRHDPMRPDAGRFQIEAVPPATYQLRASGHDRTGRLPPYFLSELRVGGLRQQSHELTVGDVPLPEVEIVMAPSARISGVVINEDGSPTPDAIVLLGSDENDWDFETPSATTDQRGRFEMTGNLPGTCVLYAIDSFDPEADDPATLRRLLYGKGEELEVEKAGNHHVQLRVVVRE